MIITIILGFIKPIEIKVAVLGRIYLTMSSCLHIPNSHFFIPCLLPVR